MTTERVKENLITAFTDAAGRAGYQPYAGSSQRLAAEVMKFPAMWITPPVMVSQNGRVRGSRIYETEVKLMALTEQDTPVEKSSAWAGMEEDMMSICREAEKAPGVYYAEASRLVCGEFSLTVSGEVSLSAKVSVKMHFCPACTG